MSEPVLTPTGWSTMGMLRPFDFVIGSDGRPTEVMGYYPQGTIPVYRVEFSDGSFVRCCGEHLWSVHTKSQKCRGSKATVKATSELKTDLRDGSGDRKWFVPVVAPIEFAALPGSITLPVAPYVVGAMLGDGGYKYGMHLSSADTEVVNRVAGLLPLGCSLRQASKYDYSILTGPNQGWGKGSALRQLLGREGAATKRIPQQYMLASVADRIELLRGLMDTDGTIRESDHHAEFNTVSRGLAEDVCDLVRSLGGVTRVRTKKPGSYTHKGEKRQGMESFRVTVSLPMNPFHLQRKAFLHKGDKNQGRTKAIVSILPDGHDECVCIAVAAPDSLYVTRNYTLTHNTVMMGGLARHWPRGRVMMIAHRFELNQQALKAFEHICDEEVGLEQASFQADRFGGRHRIVVASVQSLNSRRKTGYRFERFDPADFGLILIDEAHRAAAATYRRVVDYFLKGNPDLRVVGVTATPDRLDGVGMGCVFQGVVGKYDIVWGIRNGYLVEPVQHFVRIDGLDFSKMKTVGGDLSEADLAAAVEQEEVLHAMAKPIVEQAGKEQAIVFTASVAQAHRLAELIRDYYDREHGSVQSDTAVAIDGSLSPQDPRRRHIVDAFKAGHIQFLVNCGVATEGFDAPNVRLIAIGRPTKSRALYCFDSQTEVLTEHGWVPGESVSVGTPILAFDPETNSVQFEAIEGFVKRPLNPDEQFVEIDSASVDIRVTTSHRMCLSVRKGRKHEFQPWEFRPASGMAKLRDKFRLPAAGQAYQSGVPLSDDDLRFIAWVMTDGTVNHATRAVQISQQYPEQRAEIERVLDSCGFKWRASVSSAPTHYGPRKFPVSVYRISHGQPRKEDKHLSGWGRLESWIPKEDPNAWSKLEAMSNRQFDIFLETWHRGDGCKQVGQPWERRSYHLAVGRDNKPVADWLQQMCIMRGWRANIGWSGTAWVVHCKASQTRSVDPRDVHVTEATDEDVWCVSVPSGALFTRRNGKVVVAGNTQMVGRGTRTLPGMVDDPGMTIEDRLAAIASSDKTHCKVLDFIGQAGRHKLVCTTDILAGDTPDEVIEEAKKLQQSSDFDGSTLEALRKAEEERQRLEEARRRKVTVGVKYELHAIGDTLYDMNNVPLTSSMPGYTATHSVTEPQTRMLTKLGYTDAQILGMNKRTASAAIEYAIQNPINNFGKFLHSKKKQEDAYRAR